MRKNIKSTLIIIPIILALCFSFILVNLCNKMLFNNEEKIESGKKFFLLS